MVLLTAFKIQTTNRNNRSDDYYCDGNGGQCKQQQRHQHRLQRLRQRQPLTIIKSDNANDGNGNDKHQQR